VQRGWPRGPGWGRREEAKGGGAAEGAEGGGEGGRVLGVAYARATRDSGGEIYTGSLQPSAVPLLPSSLCLSLSLPRAMNTQVTRRVESARQERYREGVAPSPSGRKSPITHRFEIRGRRSIIERDGALWRRGGGNFARRKNARIGSLIAVANLTRRFSGREARVSISSTLDISGRLISVLISFARAPPYELSHPRCLRARFIRPLSLTEVRSSEDTSRGFLESMTGTDGNEKRQRRIDGRAVVAVRGDSSRLFPSLSFGSRTDAVARDRRLRDGNTF